MRLVTPGGRPPHSHFFCTETDTGVGNTNMAVQRQRQSVHPVGLLVDTVPFETVETVKRPSSCPASCTRAGASSSSSVTLPTFVDGVPFETLEIAKRPSSCPASFTRAGASSSSPVRLPSARQADIQQDEHNPGGETSSGHYREGNVEWALRRASRASRAPVQQPIKSVK